MSYFPKFHLSFEKKTIYPQIYPKTIKNLQQKPET